MKVAVTLYMHNGKVQSIYYNTKITCNMQIMNISDKSSVSKDVSVSVPVANDINMVSQDMHGPHPIEHERIAHRWFVGYSVTLPLSTVWRQRRESD